MTIYFGKLSRLIIDGVEVGKDERSLIFERDVSPKKLGDKVTVPVIGGELGQSENLAIKWKCGCPLIAQRDWEEGESLTVGGPQFPIRCPEHNAPFTEEVLNCFPVIRIMY